MMMMMNPGFRSFTTGVNIYLRNFFKKWELDLSKRMDMDASFVRFPVNCK